MTEAKHTPGPWAHLPDGRSKEVPLRAHHCEKLGFAVCFVSTDRGGEPAANARLIAAAPDLLAALALAVRQNSHDMLMTGEELRQCEAAIAAATGAAAMKEQA